MKKLGIFLSLLLEVSVLLSGCYSAMPEQTVPTEPEQTTTSEMTQTSVPSENTEETEIEKELKTFVTYPAPHVYSQDVTPASLLPAEDGGFYIPTTTVVKYMQEDGSQMIMCGVGGCKHSDNTCPAYFKGISCLSVYNGKFIVATDEQAKLGGTAILYRSDPVSGNRRELCRWNADQESTVYADTVQCIADTAFCSLIYYNEETKTYSYVLSSVSILDGSQRVLRTCEGNESMRLFGIVDRGLIVETRELTQEPMNYYEFFAANPDADQEAYDAYWFDAVEQNTDIRLELIDMAGGVIETITNSESGYLSPVGSAASCWGQYVIYQEGTELICYDTENQTHKVLAEGETVNYMIFDGRAMQILRGDDRYHYMLWDIFTDECIELSQEMLYITPYVETDDAFIGLGSAYHGAVLISKQDFYNEVYDNVVQLAKWN